MAHIYCIIVISGNSWQSLLHQHGRDFQARVERNRGSVPDRMKEWQKKRVRRSEGNSGWMLWRAFDKGNVSILLLRTTLLHFDFTRWALRKSDDWCWHRKATSRVTPWLQFKLYGLLYTLRNSNLNHSDKKSKLDCFLWISFRNSRFSWQVLLILHLL